MTTLFALCEYMSAAKEGKISNPKVEKSFISSGLCNWEDATTKFRKHTTSESYKEAVERRITIQNQTHGIGESLSAAHSEQKAANRNQLLTFSAVFGSSLGWSPATGP